MKKIQNKIFNGGDPRKEIDLQPTQKKASVQTTIDIHKYIMQQSDYGTWTFKQLLEECLRRRLL